MYTSLIIKLFQITRSTRCFSLRRWVQSDHRANFDVHKFRRCRNSTDVFRGTQCNHLVLHMSKKLQPSRMQFHGIAERARSGGKKGERDQLISSLIAFLARRKFSGSFLCHAQANLFHSGIQRNFCRSAPSFVPPTSYVKLIEICFLPVWTLWYMACSLNSNGTLLIACSHRGNVFHPVSEWINAVLFIYICNRIASVNSLLIYLVRFSNCLFFTPPFCFFTRRIIDIHFLQLLLLQRFLHALLYCDRHGEV